ncbi:dehydration-induced 19 -like protein [Gossypium arboreum]|uniref:Dehydration-induced 19-like protein n=1 Tax=Gossypium arboreum TaxID=29729 RepID=A0A0B0P219_GOSAR|nr:dehydration-induced 19 -like protein [Gossypium arboreum]
MESNSWSFRFSNSSSSSSSSSRRRQSRSDLFLGGGYEEIDGDEDFKAQFLCPFCAEDFDIVGLCCHIDEEHPVEAKNGVCPVCAKRVGMDIRKRRLRKGGSNLTFSMLRKELREGNLQALLGGSSFLPSPNVEADPKPQQSQLSDKDHEEKARRCEFIQGLLMSTFLDYNL